MEIGKLYRLDDGEFIVEVDYRFHDESPINWWGELVLREYRRLADGDGYIIEIKDGRKGRCFLRKRVNRAVSGTPPLYHYNFKGRGHLE